MHLNHAVKVRLQAWGRAVGHRRRTLARAGFLVLFGVFLGGFSLALVAGGEIYEYQDTVDGVRLPDVDAIVCLAGGRGRIAAAGDIWYRYWELAQTPVKGAGRSPAPGVTPTLYFSGMGRQAGWTALTRQLRRGVLQVIHPSDVVIENESSNTDENARWLARYASEHGWETVLLVTSPYHMRRARLIFDRVLGVLEVPVEVETLSVYQEPFEPGEWRTSIHGIRVTITEYLKWLYYRAFWKPEPPAAKTGSSD